MNVEVVSATASDVGVIENLVNLYLHEFSGTDPEATGEVGPDGKFRYRHLYRYWEEAGRYPFLIRVDGRLAGFALVARGELVEPQSPGHTIAEFFVLRPYRGKGVGEESAGKLFGMFPGRWWVAQHPGNKPAQAFWRTVIARYVAGGYEETRRTDGQNDAIVQTFNSPVPLVNLFDPKVMAEREKSWTRFHEWEATIARTRAHHLDSDWAWYQEAWMLTADAAVPRLSLPDPKIERTQKARSRLARLRWPS